VSRGFGIDHPLSRAITKKKRSSKAASFSVKPVSGASFRFRILCVDRIAQHGVENGRTILFAVAGLIGGYSDAAPSPTVDLPENVRAAADDRVAVNPSVAHHRIGADIDRVGDGILRAIV